MIHKLKIQKANFGKAPHLFLLGLIPLLKTNTEVPNDLINHATILAITTIISFITFTNKQKEPTSINYLDFYLFLGVAYVIMQHILHHDSSINLAYNGLEIASIVLFYISIKKIFSKKNEIFNLKKLLLFIALITSIVVVIEITQQLISNGHLIYPQSGPMGNPGASAGFIGILLMMIGPNLGHKFNNRTEMYLTYSIIIVLVFALFACQSRAALIGVFSGLATSLALRRIDLARKLNFSLIALLVFTLFFVVHLLFEKKNSLVGRSFILTRSLAIIDKRPMLGSGPNTFGITYNYNQADYFERTQLNDQSYVFADVVPFALNEYIQCFIEYGLVGVSILICIVYQCLKISKHRQDIKLIESIIMVLVFALFSYPFHTTPTLILCILLMALCSSLDKNSICESTYGKIFTRKLPMRILIVSILLFQGVFIYFLFKWKEAESLASNHNDVSNIQYKSLLPVLSFDGRFLLMYGRSLHYANKYDDSNKLLLKSIETYPSSETFQYIGFNYLKSGDSTANKYFRRAVALAPSRVFPRYDLMQSYLSFGMVNSAKAVASDILKMKIKYPSIETDMIKIKAQQVFKMQ